MHRRWGWQPGDNDWRGERDDDWRRCEDDEEGRRHCRRHGDDD